jgi:hypothetical protein
MVKIKGIIATGVILLFLGLALSPVSAQMTIKERLESSTIGNIASVQLSDNDFAVMQKYLPTLFEKMRGAATLPSLMDIIYSFLAEHSQKPVIVFVLKLLIQAINLDYKINQLRPLRTTAFIMSWGFTNKFLSLGKNKLNIVRPMTVWYYSGRSNVLFNSRTIIFDLYPFSIRTLTGRQVGLMTDFIGLYIHRSGTIGDKAITFFFGYAQTIRGIDLSPHS